MCAKENKKFANKIATMLSTALLATTLNVYAGELSLFSGARTWNPNPKNEWGFNEDVYSRGWDTSALVLGARYSEGWWLVSGAYLGETADRMTGLRGGQFTSREARTTNYGAEIAFTPHFGPCYGKLGTWLNYYRSHETGYEYGKSYELGKTGFHRSGEYGFGCASKSLYAEYSYLNSIYTRESLVGPEFRQFYMLIFGRKF